MKLVAPIIRTIIFGCISWSVLFATRLLMLPFDLSPYVWLLIQAVVSIVAGVLAGLLLRGKLYSAHLEIKSLLVTLLPYIVTWIAITFFIFALSMARIYNCLPMSHLIMSISEFMSPSNPDSLWLSLFTAAVFVFLTASARTRIVTADFMRFYNCTGFFLLFVEFFTFFF